ncbi:MAG: hypothetical protein O7E49_04990 [Gemmatimonadetes bacterium]|nr:hypothetical protein [Gemmatimonadota bacterium]
MSAQPCEPSWSDQFPSAELDAWVLGMGVFDDGTGNGPALYIGGGFTTGGEVTLNRIARLDGNRWAPLGSGMDGGVWALTGFDDGSGDGPALYAGGDFSNAGRVRVNSVAKWDGTSWSPLASGVDRGGVRALAVFDDGSGTGPALYAGGYFEEAGGISANNIAKWDGKSWSPLAKGIDSLVHALAVFDDGSGGGPALYAAGFFTTAGDLTVNRIAKWDGNSWSPLGEGMDGTVNALAVFDDGSGAGPALYAGGDFKAAGGVTAHRIAKWDGSTWSPLGGGMDAGVSSLTVFDNGSGGGPTFYAGGFFTTAGGISANRIAKWDGSSWSPLGSGMGSGVMALAAFDDRSGHGPALYAGGFFNSAGATQAEYIAKWEGSTWSTVGGAGLAGSACPPAGFYTACQALHVFDDGSGPGPALYAGGTFCTAGGVTVNHLARWDGRTWSPLGGGVDGDDVVVYALGVFDDGQGSAPALYAGGLFTTAGGVGASSIARWDGTGWSPVGGGVSGFVYTLTVFDDGSDSGSALYAGGYLTSAGGVEVNHIARWDGEAWSPVGGGITSDGIALVRALAVYDDGSGTGPALYAAGLFTTAGGVSASNIAKWDGSTWSAVGSGLTDTVYTLTVFDDGSGPALYAGGTFTETGGDLWVNHIAKWDGATWSAVGGGVGGPVVVLAVFDDGLGQGPALYVGGQFTTAGETSANSIARWDGTFWATLGEGVGGYQPTVRALTVFDDKSGSGPGLFAGGEFTTAGGMSSQRIAKWVGCAGVVVGDLDGDGTVGITDLLILLGSWGPCADCENCPADLDGDCTVGILDLLTLLANWNAA